MYEVIVRNLTGTRRLHLQHELISIGRHERCTVRIDEDPEILDRHAVLEMHAADIVLRKLPGDVPTKLRFCEPFQIGNTTISVRVTREQLDVPAWNVPAPAKRWRDRLADDPVEHDLLARLREQPDDDATRMVLADWLEGRGRTIEPNAITSRAKIANCPRCRCPGGWDKLAATDDECQRTCNECHEAVRYCASSSEVTGAHFRNERIAVDAAAAAEPRIHAALTRALPAGWRLERDRPGHDATWTAFRPANGSVLEQGYVVLFAADRLLVRYGGNDAGLWSPASPPRYFTTELVVTGLDDDAIVAWLATAFTTLPPSTWGYT